MLFSITDGSRASGVTAMSMKGSEESSAWLVTVRDVEDADSCYCAAATCWQSTTVVESRLCKARGMPKRVTSQMTSQRSLPRLSSCGMSSHRNSEGARTRDLISTPAMLTLVEIKTLIKRQKVVSAFMYLSYEPQHQRSVWQFAKSGRRLRSPASTEPSFRCGSVLLSAFLEPEVTPACAAGPED